MHSKPPNFQESSSPPRTHFINFQSTCPVCGRLHHLPPSNKWTATDRLSTLPSHSPHFLLTHFPSSLSQRPSEFKTFCLRPMPIAISNLTNHVPPPSQHLTTFTLPPPQMSYASKPNLNPNLWKISWTTIQFLDMVKLQLNCRSARHSLGRNAKWTTPSYGSTV